MLKSLALIVAAILLWRNAIRSKLSSITAAVLVFLSLLFTGIYVVINFLTGSGIDESVLYHLSVGLYGAAISDFRGIIFGAIAYVLVVAAFSSYVNKFIRTDKEVPKKKMRVTIALIAMAGSFYLNPAVGDIGQLYRDSVRDVAHPELPVPEHFVDVKQLDFNDTGKNIVYLFLESVERTYLDETLFPGLMPNLAALEKEALSFTNIEQAYSTNWTIAGMASSLCGIGLIVLAGNSLSRVDKFLPDAVCIGDLLDPNGYELNYLGGASLDFAGKGNFFRSHSFDKVEGREELKELLDDASYLSRWGLYDDTLYDIATTRFDELAAEDEPFGLFLLTVDTHHPRGYLSEACGDEEYADGSNSSLNVVHCADKMAADFINHIRNSPAFEDTILIVASDHLAMRNTAWEQLEFGERRNLLMFFGDSIEPGLDNKAGSTLDIGPTLLSLIGSDTESFGFGRNLLGDVPTLSEIETPIKDILIAGRDYLASLWSFARVDQGIIMDVDAERLILGDRLVGYPVLMLLDEDLKVSEMSFDFYSGNTLSERFTWLEFDQRFIWIDYCRETSLLGPNPGEYPEGFCAVYGALGANEIEGMEIDDEGEVPFNVLENFFALMTLDDKVRVERIVALDRYRKYGVIDVLKYKSSDTLSGRFFIRSAVYRTGASVVSNVKTGETVRLSRGITVVGLNADAAPTKLAHIDTCGSEEVLYDDEVVNLYDNIQDTLTGYSGFFGGFAVVVSDSAICPDPYNMDQLFAATKLNRWTEIDFRMPYIGLVNGIGEVVEYLGDKDTSIEVEASNFLSSVMSYTQRQKESLPRIGHAGGSIQGKSYTSSFDALNMNKDAFKLFEIDLVWTSDDHLVCLHDWKSNFQRLFDTEETGPVTLAEFEDLVQTKSDFQLCTLETLTDWMRENENIRIVPDVHAGNPKALAEISNSYPDLIDRFIPQIYQPGEYQLARSLGFEDVIWTLYRFGGDDRDVLSSLSSMDLYGLAMTKSRAERELARRAFEETGVLTWVHTIDTQERLDEMIALGVTEIMTNSLIPTGQ